MQGRGEARAAAWDASAWTRRYLDDFWRTARPAEPRWTDVTQRLLASPTLSELRAGGPSERRAYRALVRAALETLIFPFEWAVRFLAPYPPNEANRELLKEAVKALEKAAGELEAVGIADLAAECRARAAAGRRFVPPGKAGKPRSAHGDLERALETALIATEGSDGDDPADDQAGLAKALPERRRYRIIAALSTELLGHSRTPKLVECHLRAGVQGRPDPAWPMRRIDDLKTLEGMLSVPPFLELAGIVAPQGKKSRRLSRILLRHPVRLAGSAPHGDNQR